MVGRVGNPLDAGVGQQHVVGAGHLIAVRGLLRSEVIATGLVLDCVFIRVRHPLHLLDRGVVKRRMGEG